MINAQDFLGGKYLQKEDVPSPVMVTITRAEQKVFEGEGKKLILFFKELDKGLVTNKTNIRVAVDAFGTTNVEQWRGRQLVLFNDASVSYQGKRTGGLRFRPLAAAQQATPTPAGPTPPAEEVPF